jgi:cytochrome c oxidase subunit IV
MVADEQTFRSMAPESNSTTVYTVVWLFLLLLTAVTVAAAQLNIGKFAVIICLAVASVKSILVFLYFMHLRHERRLVVKLAVPIALVALAIFIGLTFIDVVTR